MNLQPNLTKHSGSCDSEIASLQLTVDAVKTNLIFVFTMVSFCFHHVLPKEATRWQLELEVNLL